MTQEEKKIVEESNQRYPYHRFDFNLPSIDIVKMNDMQDARRQGYCDGATKYAEEVERLRDALITIANWNDDFDNEYGDPGYFAQQALSPLDSKPSIK